MNQRDWVEYFEAINGRKPSMQEFQEAREKGEFVVEQKDAPAPAPVTPAPASEEQAPAQEAPVASSAPFSQESTLLSHRNHQRKPCNLFQDRKDRN